MQAWAWVSSWRVVLSAWVLAGCVGAPVAPAPQRLFDDSAFAAPSTPLQGDDIFALNDAMKRFVDTEIAGSLRSKGLQRGLLEALYSRRQLQLEYDAVRTRNAIEAFEARSGNCLSLVIMTAAFAKHLGLRVFYQSVVVDSTWTRTGDLYVTSGHVNLTLGRRAFDARIGSTTDEAWTVDFLAPADTRGQRASVIGEDTVVAMYLNNRAAEALASGQLDDAYAWAAQAIRRAPAFLSAYNTLGVVYLRHGNLAKAAQVLQHVLGREPDNTLAMSNLVHVLNAQGQVQEAAALAQRLARIEPYPPYHFFDLGMAALQAGDTRAARDLFAKEVARAAYHHEFHFWLAVAHLRLGNLSKAREHLAIAVENSPTPDDKALYSAKLEMLNARRVH